MREHLQLLKHHSCTTIRTELPCLADHPRSSSPRHHQSSLRFYATLPFTDLIFSPSIVVAVSYESDEFVLSSLVIELEGCGDVCVCRKALAYACWCKGKHRYLSANVCACYILTYYSVGAYQYSVWIHYVVYSYTIMSVCGRVKGRRQWCLSRLLWLSTLAFILFQKPILSCWCIFIFSPFYFFFFLKGILCTVGTQGRVLMNLNERLNLFSMFYLFFQGLGSKLNRQWWCVL